MRAGVRRAGRAGNAVRVAEGGGEQTRERWASAVLCPAATLLLLTAVVKEGQRFELGGSAQGSEETLSGPRVGTG